MKPQRHRQRRHAPTCAYSLPICAYSLQKCRIALTFSVKNSYHCGGAIMQRHFGILRRCCLPLQARAASRAFARSFAAKAPGLEGITVTKGSAAVKQAVAQQRWVVGDADSFKKCDPCEQGGKPLDRPSALALLQQTPSWTLSDDGVSISRTWEAKVWAYPCCLCAQVSSHTLSGLQERLCLFAAGGCCGRERGASPRPSPCVLQ
jgi:hypothetical protein